MLKGFFALFESTLVYIFAVRVFAIVHVKLSVNLSNTDFSTFQKYLPDFLVFCWKARCQNCGHHWCQHWDWQRDSHWPGEERLVWLKSKAEVTPHTHPHLTPKKKENTAIIFAVSWWLTLLLVLLNPNLGWASFDIRSFKTQF